MTSMADVVERWFECEIKSFRFILDSLLTSLHVPINVVIHRHVAQFILTIDYLLCILFWMQ